MVMSLWPRFLVHPVYLLKNHNCLVSIERDRKANDI